METRNQKLNALKNWITENEDIRVALITSSLVNPLAPVDDFSDIDIELVFKQAEVYLDNKNWIYQFGEVLNYYEEGIEGFDGKHAMKMVQYKDGVKVDFKIYNISQFKSEIESQSLPEDWDIGYAILVDKDNLTQGIQPATYQTAIIKKPTEIEFNKIVNDFWWDVTYLPKCLRREDLFYLKYMVEKIIRVDYLIPMIEWYIGSKNNWEVTTNKYGRLFKKYLSNEEWENIVSTFAGYDILENWKACRNLLIVFDEIANQIAEYLDYQYDQKKSKQIIDFFIHYYPIE